MLSSSPGWQLRLPALCMVPDPEPTLAQVDVTTHKYYPGANDDAQIIIKALCALRLRYPLTTWVYCLAFFKCCICAVPNFSYTIELARRAYTIMDNKSQRHCLTIVIYAWYSLLSRVIIVPCAEPFPCLATIPTVHIRKAFTLALTYVTLIIAEL